VCVSRLGCEIPGSLETEATGPGAKLGHHGERQVRGFFSDLISEVLPVDVDVADAAADLRSRRKSLRMPDALILATAEIQSEVSLVLTGDLEATKVRGLTCKVQLLR
jgi:PIN domain